MQLLAPPLLLLLQLLVGTDQANAGDHSNLPAITSGTLQKLLEKKMVVAVVLHSPDAAESNLERQTSILDAFDLATRMVAHTGSEAFLAKIDASREDMGVLKTLLDVNKRPDQFPAVRIFKLGKLYKKDIPTPANYEGEAPGLVLSNFLLQLMKVANDEAQEEKEKWDKKHAERLEMEKKVDEAEFNGKFDEIPALYIKLLQIDRNLAKDESDQEAVVSKRETLQHNLAVAFLNAGVQAKEDDQYCKQVARAKFVGCSLNEFCAVNHKHCVMEQENRWKPVPHASRLIYKKCDEYAALKRYASMTCDDLLDEALGTQTTSMARQGTLVADEVLNWSPASTSKEDL